MLLHTPPIARAQRTTKKVFSQEIGLLERRVRSPIEILINILSEY